MSLRQRSYIQYSFSLIHLLITIVFFIGWNNVMINGSYQNVIIKVITIFYFFGGGVLLLLLWFGLIIYTELRNECEKSISPSIFVKKYIFPFVCLVNIIITYIYMKYHDTENLVPSTMVHFLIFSVVLFLFVILNHITISKNINSRKYVIVFTIMGIILVLWAISMFSYAYLWDYTNEEERIFYFLTNRDIYKLIITLGVIFIFAGMIMFFNLKERLKYISLYMGLTMLIINIYIFLFMMSFLNYFIDM